MATKAPPYPKQKYTDAKFREIIPLLPLAESLKIEYLAKGVWFKMVSKRANSHNCECCGVENLGPTPIVDHIRGKKHRSALQNAEKLFHPNYTLPKNPNTAARTPLLDTVNSTAGAKAAKAIPTKVSTPVQKPAPGQQKPAAAANPKQPLQKAPVKKVTNANANANSETAKTTNVDKPAETQAGPKSVDANIASNQSAQSNQSKPPVQSQKKEPQNTSQQNQNKQPPKAPQQAQNKGPQAQVNANDPKKPATENGKEGNVSQQSANTNNSNNEKEKKEEDDDVIIISDDLDEVRKNPEKSDPVENAITVINSVPPKPQRPQKNAPKQTPAPQPQQKIQTISSQPKVVPPTSVLKKIETTPTPAKRVINPAAVLAKSADNNDANTPQYEQNRVIIPTIDKTRKRQQIEAPGPKRTELPSFSTKTFSTDVNENVDGIIGVEYVVKILKVYNDPEPFYECCLCEVVMDGIGMQTHLLGYNHRYKYVEKHFPTCFNQYKEHIGNIQVMGIILDRIAKAIESHHGRELPYECLSGEFRSNRHGVMTTVYSFRHASEYSGPSFTNVVDANQVQEFYKKKNVYLPPKPDPKRKPTFDTRNTGPSPKRNRVEPPINIRGGKRGGSRGNAGPPRRPYREEVETTLDDAVHKQMVEEFLQNTCDRARSPAGHRRRHRSRTRSRSPHRSIHKRPQRRSPSPLRDGDIWQAYRHLVDRSKVEVDEMYKEYRRDPEKHPLYDEEWRKFWKQRKDEMTRKGVDYKSHDFQPEWVRFFAVRIEELYDEALENIKINSRQRLILPMTNDELEDKKYHVKVPEYEQQEQLKTKDIQPHQEMEKKMSVVHVLRLLTALEDYLGSLGPRVVDLLSKALLVEKSNPKDVNEIVLTLENCTILETAMEKLKGVLIAGLLEGPKVRAFNNVISETEKILRYAFKIRELNPQPVPQPVPAPKSSFESQPQKQSFSGGLHASGPQQPNSMGNGQHSGAAANLLSQIDKKELATKLAAALTAQGKTDFNPEQLQQLIAVYSLIDKKKRDSAAADKQKMTLSDTLTALLNPKESNVGGSVGGGMSGSSNQASGRNVGSYMNSSNERPGGVTNSSINNFVSMLNRDSLSAGGSAKSGDSQMWQNLQNIQNSLRMQNTGTGPGSGTGPSKTGGYSSVSSVGEGREGRGNYMGDMSSGSNFNRSGFGVSGTGSGTGGATGMGRSEFSLGQNSSLNFNRGGSGGGLGTASGSKESGGFYGNFQGMSSNNANFSRSGDSMPESGRGSFGGNNRNFTGDNNYPRGGGGTDLSGANTGVGNNSRYSGAASDKFLGMGQSGGSTGSGGTGFSSNFNSGSFSSSGGFGGSSFQRGSGGSGMGLGSSSGLGMSSGGGLGMNSGASTGSSFSRGGLSSGFGSLMSNSSSFNSNPGRNETGGGQQFNSNSRSMSGSQGNHPMGRNQLGVGGGSMPMGNSSNSQNSSGSRGGSNWRNQ